MTLVAAYSFDGSDVADVTGRGHPGTLFNTPTFPAGRTNIGIQFASASSQYVEVADHADFTLGSAWTVMCWFKPTTLVVGELVCKQGQWWFSSDAAGKVAHGFYYSVGGNTSGIISTSAMSTGNWYHWAVRYNGTDYSIVFNGVQDTWSNDGGTASGKTMMDNANPVRMGSWDGATELQNGVLDDVRIYNEYLDDAAVSQLMNMPVGSPSAIAFRH